MVFIAGCARDEVGYDLGGEVTPGGVSIRMTEPVAGPTERHHDFGPILTLGQELRHRFTLSNPTDRSVRILRAEALTPCCSALGPVPEAIAPGDSVEMAVVFKPGTQSGKKGVRFAIQTDDPEDPFWEVSVSADLIPGIRIDHVEGAAGPFALGNPGEMSFVISCRRLGQEGREAPDSVKAISPLQARFDGPPVERELPEGLVEADRKVSVELPAASEPGEHKGQLVFRWADGSTWEHTIHWRVIAPIEASPTGLFLTSSAQSVQKVIIKSLDRPFRITGVTCPSLAGPPGTFPDPPGRLHVLDLTFDPGQTDAGPVQDLIISTDQPDQPTVTVSVLVSNDASGTEESDAGQ